MNLLTLREVADQIGFAPKTVRKLIHSGQLRGVEILGEWRVDQDDLDLFVTRRRT
jgi:excisionase family DNA binding protein